MPNLRSRSKYADRAWAWDFLNGAFGKTGSTIPDIDGCPEFNDHLLALEGKPANWAWEWNNGQFRMLRSFAKRPGQTAIILCGDNPEEPVILRAMVVSPLREDTHLIETTTKRVVACIEAWYAHTRACAWALTTCTYRDEFARQLAACDEFSQTEEGW